MVKSDPSVGTFNRPWSYHLLLLQSHLILLLVQFSLPDPSTFCYNNPTWSFCCYNLASLILPLSVIRIPLDPSVGTVNRPWATSFHLIAQKILEDVLDLSSLFKPRTQEQWLAWKWHMARYNVTRTRQAFERVQNRPSLLFWPLLWTKIYITKQIHLTLNTN